MRGSSRGSRFSRLTSSRANTHRKSSLLLSGISTEIYDLSLKMSEELENVKAEIAEVKKKIIIIENELNEDQKSNRAVAFLSHCQSIDCSPRREK